MDSEYLKYLVKSNDLKLYELGEQLGLNQQYFYKKIKKGRWTIEEMKVLKEILHMTNNDFNRVFGLEFDE